MDVNSKITGSGTPAKNPPAHRSKISAFPKYSENCNPNVTSPVFKSKNSPAIKSATKTQKSAFKNPNPVVPLPRNKIRERKFVIAKRNSNKEKSNSSTVTCNCKDKVGYNSQKCLCVAYESLRASQEEFFKNRACVDDHFDSEQLNNWDANGVEEREVEKKPSIETQEIADGYEINAEEVEGLGANGSDPNEIEQSGEMGCSNFKRRRERVLEEARRSVPEPGSGRVMHLVKAFERLLTIPKSKDLDQKDEEESEEGKKGTEWALPGLQPTAYETQVSSSSFCPSDFFLTSESLGLDSRVSSSLDSYHGRTSGDACRRRNSSGSCGTYGGTHYKKRQLKATCQKPFKLRTEQRGRNKEEELIKKVQQMMIEEEKQRIPIAQGLPWTTDEPEYLVKPPIKESTKPIDLVLHSDVRALERAEFDHQMAEKMSLIEQYREEMERQQKLSEEDEIRRLRKELVPKAQPMPYFDRPFIPRRSGKHPTMPREPKFHLPQHKKIKCCMSWNDFYTPHL